MAQEGKVGEVRPMYASLKYERVWPKEGMVKHRSSGKTTDNPDPRPAEPLPSESSAARAALRGRLILVNRSTLCGGVWLPQGYTACCSRIKHLRVLMDRNGTCRREADTSTAHGPEAYARRSFPLMTVKTSKTSSYIEQYNQLGYCRRPRLQTAQMARFLNNKLFTARRHFLLAALAEAPQYGDGP
jgi:hypothetical protein